MAIFSVKSILGKLFLVCLSLILAVGLIELSLRLFGGELAQNSKLPISWIIFETDLWQIDPDLIFGLKSVEARIATASNQVSPKPLILILGDSFAEGNPVGEEFGFVARMSQILTQKKIDHTILNVGTSGYGVDQELTLLKKILVKGIRPKIVVWTFYYNDVFENGQQPTFTIDSAGKLQPISGVIDFRYQRQQFYQAIPLPEEIKSQSAFVTALLHFYNLKILDQVPEVKSDDLRTPWAYQKMQLEIAEAYELGKKYEFQILPILIEQQADYFSGPRLQTIPDEVGYMDDFLKNKPNYLRLNLSQLIELPKYRQLFNQNYDPLLLFSGSENDNSIFGLRHFNVLGYKLFGDIVAENIEKLIIKK